MKRTLFVLAGLLLGGSAGLAAPLEDAPPSASAVEKFISPTIGKRWAPISPGSSRWSNVAQTGSPAVFEGTGVAVLAFQWRLRIWNFPGGKESVLAVGYRNRFGQLNLTKVLLASKGGDRDSIDVSRWAPEENPKMPSGFKVVDFRNLWVVSGEDQSISFEPTSISKEQRNLRPAVLVKLGETLKVKGMSFFACRSSAVDVLCSMEVGSHGTRAFVRLYAPWTTESYTVWVLWGDGHKELREQGAVPPPA